MAILPFSDEPDRQRRRFPFIVIGLVLLNVLVFVYELSLPMSALEQFARSWGVIPAEILRGQDLPPGIPVPVYATLITSQFLHGGFLHIVSNMIFLWIFGDNLEDALGHVTFLVFYLSTGIAAGLINALVLGPVTEPGIGASGAIAGVLAGYLIIFPRAEVRVFLGFGPFWTVGRVAAVLLAAVWFLSQLGQGIASLGVPAQEGGVAYFAHIGGFVFGLTVVPAIRLARGQRIGELTRGAWVGPTMRNWLLLVFALGLLFLGTQFLADTDNEGLALVSRGLIVLGAVLFALYDGVRRILGKASFLGTAAPGGRFAAYIQVLTTLGLIGAFLAGVV